MPKNTITGKKRGPQKTRRRAVNNMIFTSMGGYHAEFKGRAISSY